MIDVSNFTNKDDLAAFAQETYGVELDLRKGWAVLVKQVKELQEGPAKVEEAKVEEVAVHATHILNRDTLKVFPYTDALRKHLQNAIPCDENGKPV